MKLNEDVVKALEPPSAGNKVHYFPDAILQGTRTPPGFGIRVTAAGAKSFVLNYRSNHIERRITIGQWPTWPVLKAVKEARRLKQNIDRGIDPLDARRKQEAVSRDTLEAVCGEYFQREGHKLRSREERERALKRLVLPTLGRKDVRAIARGDIVRLLDAIEDGSGAVMATRTLAYLGRVLSWFESRNDDFTTPIRRGMGRANAKERARQRVLSDDELRAVWKATTAFSPYSRLVRFILLTGARRDEAASMPWEELDGDTWLLPQARNKVKQDLLRPLSKQALAVLPKRNGGKFVFSNSSGARPIGSFSDHLADLHAASGTSGWSLHDLRRTARTLMSRAGVLSDHAEHCLGHVLPTIRGTYDRHEYAREKKAAYEALAAQIEHIVNPPADNVTPIKAARHG